MKTQTITDTDPHKTIRRALPYKFSISIHNKISIHKLNGQCLIVSRKEIENQLNRLDLDVHRRHMYEAALEYLEKHQ